VWKGTAETLKANPTNTKMIASVMEAALPCFAKYTPMSVSFVEPATP